jgi:hypothetical protein
LHRWPSLAGYDIYLYFDRLLPFVVEYRVFPLDSTEGGFVRVLNLVDPHDVPPEVLGDL